MVLMCSNEKIDNTSFTAATAKVMKAESVVKIDGVIVVKLANGRFLTSARDFDKWAYHISHGTIFREPVLRGLAAIGYITSQEVDEHMAEHRAARAGRDAKYAKEMLVKYAGELGLSEVVENALSKQEQSS